MRRILGIALTSTVGLAVLWPSAIGAQDVERFTMRTKQGNTFDVKLRAVTSPGDDPFFYAEMGESRPGYKVGLTTIALWFEGVSGDGTIFIRLRNPADLDDARPRVDRVLRYRMRQDGTAKVSIGVLGSKEAEGERGKRDVLVFRVRLTDQDELQVSFELQSGQIINK